MRFGFGLLSALIVALLLCGGKVLPDDSTKIWPFLSDFANSDYYLKWADFKLLDYIARENCEAYLTDELIKTSLGAYWGSSDTCLHVYVNTRPQPEFETAVSNNGRFKISDREVKVVFVAAADRMMKEINRMAKLFEFPTERVAIYFALRGNPVGCYYNSEFKLEGE